MSNSFKPKVVYTEKSIVDLGDHVFPMQKYALLYKLLLKEKTLNREDFFEPQQVTEEDILLVHTKLYWEKLKNCRLSLEEIIQLELPFSEELLNAVRFSVGGTILACELALKHKVSVNIGGGFHHAFSDHGEGFCVLNDIAIAIERLKREGLAKRIMVIDCDLHQGNGTAAIFDSNPEVFTFSIHEEDIYPVPKARSNLDIGLPSGTEDKEYLCKLYENIPKIIFHFKPELIIYVAGADPFENDQLGSLKISKEGLEKRDFFITKEALKHKIPLSIVLGGGYSINIEDIIWIHYNTIKATIKALNETGQERI